MNCARLSLRLAEERPEREKAKKRQRREEEETATARRYRSSIVTVASRVMATMGPSLKEKNNAWLKQRKHRQFSTADAPETAN
jgi:hypothetical protein